MLVCWPLIIFCTTTDRSVTKDSYILVPRAFKHFGPSNLIMIHANVAVPQRYLYWIIRMIQNCFRKVFISFYGICAFLTVIMSWGRLTLEPLYTAVDISYVDMILLVDTVLVSSVCGLYLRWLLRLEILFLLVVQYVIGIMFSTTIDLYYIAFHVKSRSISK